MISKSRLHSLNHPYELRKEEEEERQRTQRQRAEQLCFTPRRDEEERRPTLRPEEFPQILRTDRELSPRTPRSPARSPRSPSPPKKRRSASVVHRSPQFRWILRSQVAFVDAFAHGERVVP